MQNLGTLRQTLLGFGTTVPMREKKKNTLNSGLLKLLRGSHALRSDQLPKIVAYPSCSVGCKQKGGEFKNCYKVPKFYMGS
jgi:hypothetical protein